MSSSTSNSKAPHFSNPIQVIVFTVLFALITAAAVIGVNAWIDPFDSAISPIRKEVNRVKNFRTKNVALWAAFDIEDISDNDFRRAQVVLLGDSRMRLMSGGAYSERSYMLEGKRVIDLAFGGASIKESLDVFRTHQHKMKSLEKVFISAPYDRLVDGDGVADRYIEASRSAKFPLLYLLNTNTLEKSLPLLLAPASTSRHSTLYIRPPRIGEAQPECEKGFDALDEELPVRDPRRRASSLLKWEDAQQVFDRQVSPFIEDLNKAGVAHTIFVPPNSPRMEAFLTETLKYRFDNYLAHAGNVSSVLRVPPETLNGVIWQDDWHVCINSGAFVMDQVWSEFDT